MRLYANRAVLAIVFWFAIAVVVTASHDFPLRWGPVLGVLTDSSVEISWCFEQPAYGAIRYTTKDEYQKTHVMHFLIPSPVKEELHHVCLTDLTPATAYVFQVILTEKDRELVGPIGEFTTAPKADDTFTFLVWGDTHAGKTDSVFEYVANQMAHDSSHPLFAVAVGDLVHRSTETHWRTFFNGIYNLALSTPILAVPGNHELLIQCEDCDSTLYFDYLQLPQGGGIADEEWWSITYGDVLLVGLNTCAVGVTNGRLVWPPGQFQWLEETLSTSSANVKIVFTHFPMYSSGMKNGRFSRDGVNVCLEEDLKHILIKGGVNLFINGHIHSYQHIYRDGIHFVTTGGGGCFYENPYRVKTEGEVKWIEHVYHYLRITICENRVTVQMIGVGEWDGTSLIPYAKPKCLDEFVIIKR